VCPAAWSKESLGLRNGIKDVMLFNGMA